MPSGYYSDSFIKTPKEIRFPRRTTFMLWLASLDPHVPIRDQVMDDPDSLSHPGLFMSYFMDTGKQRRMRVTWARKPNVGKGARLLFERGDQRRYSLIWMNRLMDELNDIFDETPAMVLEALNKVTANLPENAA